MANSGIKSGATPGRNGGVYQEQESRGGLKDNFVTIPDNRPAPPTTQPGSTCFQNIVIPTVTADGCSAKSLQFRRFRVDFCVSLEGIFACVARRLCVENLKGKWS